MTRTLKQNYSDVKNVYNDIIVLIFNRGEVGRERRKIINGRKRGNEEKEIGIRKETNTPPQR